MDSLLSDYPPLMLRSEVSEVLRVKEKTLADWAPKGIGPKCLYLSERVPRYKKGDVVDYLEGL